MAGTFTKRTSHPHSFFFESKTLVMYETEVSSTSLPDNSWDTFSRSLLEESGRWDWIDEWSDFSDFSTCCPRLSESTILAEQQAEDLFAIDFSNESHMNAAGRDAMHPWRDIRSASYARNRCRTRSRSGPRTRSIGGRKWFHAERRIDNKRQRKNILRYEVEANQRRQNVWSPGKPKRIDILVWDVRLEEEFDEHIGDMIDDVVLYEKLHKNAEVFENTDHDVQTGETFSIWAQRRIAEMRVVKESRMKASSAPRQQPMAYKTLHMRPIRVGAQGFDYSIYCGSSLTTTLPPCCNSGNGSMFYECYCEDFGDEVAPDEQQRCSLIEWVGSASQRLLIDEGRFENDVGTNDSGSSGASETDGDWSLVDECWDVRSYSSTASFDDLAEEHPPPALTHKY